MNSRMGFKKVDIWIGLLLVICVAVIQSILARKHLQFGWFIDDWIFLTIYLQHVPDPIFGVYAGWKALGAHNFAHAYYIGVLHSLFGFNYLAYHITNEILKIIASLSLYPLILILFKKRLLAFLSSVIYVIHYSTFGTLDNASRGEDFIAIIFMNIFFIIYIQILKKGIYHLRIMSLMLVIFFITLLLDVTRMFPLILLLPLIEIFYLILSKGRQFGPSLIRLAYFYTPFIVLLFMSPDSVIPQLKYPTELLNKIGQGNLQLFLAPFASFGSTFVPKEYWQFFGNGIYDFFRSYVVYLLIISCASFFMINTVIGWLANIDLRKFLTRTLILNAIFGVLAYFLVNHYYKIDKTVVSPVDPGIYLTPALIGIFIYVIGITFLIEYWKKGKNTLFLGVFCALTFSLLFVILTWIFGDRDSIFMGVHAYLNIPAMGSSIFLAILLTFTYEKIKSLKSNLNMKFQGVVIVIALLSVFTFISGRAIDGYFSFWLDHGLRVTDQERFMKQFFQYFGNPNKYGTGRQFLIFLDTSEDYPNGAFYDLVIIQKIESWLAVLSGRRVGRPNFCDLIILDKNEFNKTLIYDKTKKVLFRNKCGPMEYKLEDFYAFKLKDRDLSPIRGETLGQLGVFE